MAAATVTKLYSTEDCKIRQILTDPAGGSATFGDWIDVPGIRQVTLTPQIESKQLRGDNRELDADSTLAAVEVSGEHAKLSYDVLEVILGGTVAVDGSWSKTGDSPLNYFEIAWRTPTGGVDDAAGDVHFHVCKAKVTAYTLGTAFEDYQLMSFTARGVYRQSDDLLVQIIPHETAEDIDEGS